jgi:hypothetical protein
VRESASKSLQSLARVNLCASALEAQKIESGANSASRHGVSIQGHGRKSRVLAQPLQSCSGFAVAGIDGHSALVGFHRFRVIIQLFVAEAEA